MVAGGLKLLDFCMDIMYNENVKYEKRMVVTALERSDFSESK